MAAVNEALAAADAVVLATPLYYYGMTAQLKTAIDRFYAANKRIQNPKRLFLLAACEDSDATAMDALVAHVETFGRYLGWSLEQPLLAFGCGTRADIEKTDYPTQAEALARGL